MEWPRSFKSKTHSSQKKKHLRPPNCCQRAAGPYHLASFPDWDTKLLKFIPIGRGRMQASFGDLRVVVSHPDVSKTPSKNELQILIVDQFFAYFSKFSGIGSGTGQNKFSDLARKIKNLTPHFFRLYEIFRCRRCRPQTPGAETPRVVPSPPPTPPSPHPSQGTVWIQKKPVACRPSCGCTTGSGSSCTRRGPPAHRPLSCPPAAGARRPAGKQDFRGPRPPATFGGGVLWDQEGEGLAPTHPMGGSTQGVTLGIQTIGGAVRRAAKHPHSGWKPFPRRQQSTTLGRRMSNALFAGVARVSKPFLFFGLRTTSLGAFLTQIRPKK